VDGDLAAVVSIGLTFIACIGGIIARDRYLSAAIVSGDKAVREELDKKIDNCHERVNKTRDDFVRRDDLDSHMTRIEKSITGMHDEQKEMNKRIDTFMTALAARQNGNK
jgi:hypothetical protein